MSDRYPDLKFLGADAFDTSINSEPYYAGSETPLALAGENHIRRAIEPLKRIQAYMQDEKYAAKIAMFEAELAYRAEVNARVALPDVELPYHNLWTKKDGTWNPSKGVIAVRTFVQTQGGRYLDLGHGSIGLATSPAHALRIAEYWQRQGWSVEAVACACLFSDNESHLPIVEGGR